MAMSMIAHPHIRLDEQGIAWIDDANVKVIEVVLDRLAYGWSPEEISLRSTLRSPITTITRRRLTRRSSGKNRWFAGCGQKRETHLS
jgi:hypothetical protein